MIFNPKGKFIYNWHFLNATLILYNATATPFRVAFHTTATSSLLFSFEVLVDFIFFLDILVTSLTPYERFDSTYETRANKIVKRYISNGTFYRDLIAVLPTALFESHQPPNLDLAEEQRLLR